MQLHMHLVGNLPIMNNIGWICLCVYQTNLRHQFTTKQFKNGKQRFYKISFYFGFGRFFNGSGQFHNYKFFPIPL